MIITRDPWKMLGLEEGATRAQIKRAYRLKSKKAHPDKGGSHQDFLDLTEAYESLLSRPNVVYVERPVASAPIYPDANDLTQDQWMDVLRMHPGSFRF